MILDDKKSVVQYAQELINSELEIPYYNLKRLFELNGIEIAEIVFKESQANNLTVLECSNLKDNRVNLTISEKSWIEYLPSIYKDNAELKKFLYGMQVSMFKQKEIVDHIEDIFIPRKSEFLDWLASWYGVGFSSLVNSDTKRRLIYRLIKLYKKRGTKEYLIEMVKILTGKNIEIRERTLPDYLKEDNRFMGEKYNLNIIFSVKILDKFSDDKNRKQEKLLIKKIKNILDREKPAFTEYYIDSDVVQESKIVAIDAIISSSIDDEPFIDYYEHEKEEKSEKIVENKISEKDEKDDDTDDWFSYD